MDFGLSPSNLDAASKKAWPHNFGLIYSVTLSTEGLETSMVVRNEGGEAWDFQVLMHTYLRVKVTFPPPLSPALQNRADLWNPFPQDISNVTVTGLQSSSYFDKVASATKTESAAALKLTGETDRVYSPADGPLVVAESGRKIYEVVRDNLENVVVWNPWKDKVGGMGDFMPKEGWRNMICVEAGKVAGWVKLDAGDAWEGGVLVRPSL